MINNNIDVIEYEYSKLITKINLFIMQNNYI